MRDELDAWAAEEAAAQTAANAARATANRALLQRVLQEWWAVTAAALVEAQRRLQRRGGNVLGIGGLSGKAQALLAGEDGMGLWSQLRGDRADEEVREFTCRVVMHVWHSNASARRKARRRAAMTARAAAAVTTDEGTNPGTSTSTRTCGNSGNGSCARLNDAGGGTIMPRGGVSTPLGQRLHCARATALLAVCAAAAGEPWEQSLGRRPCMPSSGITKPVAAAAEAMVAAVAAEGRPATPFAACRPARSCGIDARPPRAGAPSRTRAGAGTAGGGCAARRQLKMGQHAQRRQRKVASQPQVEPSLQCKTARRMYAHLFGVQNILAAAAAPQQVVLPPPHVPQQQPAAAAAAAACQAPRLLAAAILRPRASRRRATLCPHVNRDESATLLLT